MKYYRYWLMYEKEEEDEDFSNGWMKVVVYIVIYHGADGSIGTKRVLYMNDSEKVFEVEITDGILRFKDSGELVDTRRWGCVGAWQWYEFWEWYLDICRITTISIVRST